MKKAVEEIVQYMANVAVSKIDSERGYIKKSISLYFILLVKRVRGMFAEMGFRGEG